MKIAASIFKTLFLCLCIIANTHLAYAQTASILPQGKTQFLDNNGKPLTSGTVDFYIPSTTTRKTTWQNSAETVANSNPVVLDAGGRAIIYGDGSYRQVVKDRLGNVIWDQVTSSTGSGSGGSTATGDGDLVGTIKPWAGMTAPNQYVFTYGQEISRTTYSALFTAITSSQSVFCTSGSPTLTGLSDTTNFWVGASVEVSCLAAGFSTIISKTSSSITLASNANVSTNVTAIIFPWGRGNGTTTFNVPDLRGFAIAGNNNMGGVASSQLNTTYFGATDPNSVGAAGGSQSKVLLTANLPPYTPAGAITNGAITITQNALINNNGSSSPSGAFPIPGAGAATISASQAISTFAGAAQGGTSTAFSIIQPTKTSNYIIKITPDTNSATASGVTSLGGMTGDIACGTGLLCTGNNISSNIAIGGSNTQFQYNSAGSLAGSSVLTQQNVASYPFIGVGDNIADAILRWSGTKFPVLTIDRLVDWSAVNDNTVADMTTLTPLDNAGTNNYASYSSRLYSVSNKNFGHWAAFEDLKLFNAVSPSVMSTDWSFLSNPTYSGTGAVTRREAFAVYDVLGTGTGPVTQIGFYTNPMTKGTTNWGIYIDGTTQSFFGGNVNVGIGSPASGTARAVAINGAAAGTNAGSAVLFQNGGAVTNGIGNTSAIIGGAYDATTLVYSSTNAYRFSGLTAGLGTLSSNGTFTSTALGTGVLTALGVNVGSVGAVVVNGGALGTPSSGTLSNATGLPISTGVSGLGSGVSAALGVNVGTAGSFVVNGGVLGSPSSVGTLPAFTLGGTISGGGNQLNNIVIGTTTPLAGNFTTLITSTSETVPLISGGTGAASTLTLQSTSGAGTTDAVIFKTASQVERARIITSGFFNVGPNVAPDSLFTLNANTGSTVAPDATAQFHMIGADSVTSGIYVDNYNSTNILAFRYAGGTQAIKTAAAANKNSVIISSYTWDGTAYSPNATMDFFTGSNTQSGSDHAGLIRFRTTPLASTTIAEAMRIQPSGGISIGTTTDPGIGALLANASISTPLYKSATAPTAVSGAGPILIGSGSTINSRMKVNLNGTDYWIPVSTTAF